MLDVVVYISSVLNPNKHYRKVACLENFALGVTNAGGTVQVQRANEYIPSKLAVILGWVTEDGTGANIRLRKTIIEKQKEIGYHTMCIDASCWKYLDNYGTYLRYSIGGPFYDKAEYANRNSSSEKWEEISQALQTQLQDPQINMQGHILICVQRDGGFSMKNLDPLEWLDEKIAGIRKFTNRKILVRPHPGTWQDPTIVRVDKKGRQKSCLNKYYWPDFKPLVDKYDVTIIDPLLSKLQDNLVDAHSAVFFNSSASVAAVCAGIPVFVDDQSCVAWKVANKNIRNIEYPRRFNKNLKQQWLYDLAAAHWSDDDARSGKIYQKFLPYIDQSSG
jgi:hypothetical protein